MELEEKAVCSILETRLCNSKLLYLLTSTTDEAADNFWKLTFKGVECRKGDILEISPNILQAVF